MTKKAAVIGSGIGGLAAAIRLAVKGFNVEIYEKNNFIGGKIGEIKENGYRWDTGPSLLTLPELIDELFTLAGKDPRDYFKYHRVDLINKYFYEDGTLINAWADQRKFAEEIELKTTESAASVMQYLKKSEQKYNLTKNVFLESSLHKTATYFSPAALKAYFQLRKLNAFKTLHRYNTLSFRDERVVQLFDRFATYNGSDPYHAPATLSIVPHLEHNLGVYFPENGMYSIVKSLTQLADDLGIEFHLNRKVDKVLISNNTVTGIESENEKINYDLVICNCDVITAYQNLLSKDLMPKSLQKPELSSSAYIFYWGINREFQNLNLHNIFFSNNYLQEFYHLFNHKKLYDDPTVYVNISSKENAADAPKGKENWFVMINVPPHNTQNWNDLKDGIRWNIVLKLNRILQLRVDQFIETEHVLDPELIESRTSSFGGALYGTSSNNKMAAFFRHPNFSQKIKNLYFAGGSVHPGGGIPLSLLSAKIAVDNI